MNCTADRSHLQTIFFIRFFQKHSKFGNFWSYPTKFRNRKHKNHWISTRKKCTKNPSQTDIAGSYRDFERVVTE